MARLPTPGGDKGNWGEILNEYLRQGHHDNGAISKVDGNFAKLQLRRATSSLWTETNPTLAAGEIGFETDTHKRKVGDGTQTWNDLSYDLTQAVADERYAGISQVEVLTPGQGEIVVGGQSGPEAVSVDSIGNADNLVNDAIGEWWIHPIATYQDRPYPRTVFGAIAENGDILACEFTHGTGTTRRYVIDNVSPDDHKVPLLWVSAGRRPVIMWQSHGQNQLMRYRIGSRSEDIASLQAYPTRTHAPGGRVAYSQLFRINHLSNGDQDTFYVFYRASGDGWRMFPMTVFQGSGKVTFGDTTPVLVAWNDAYLTISDAHNTDGNQILRIVGGTNPSKEHNHPLYYVELDCVTGEFTSPLDDSFSANTDGTNLPMPSSLTPWVGPLAEGNARRLFYVRPGPDAPAIAYADWSVSSPDEAIYKVSSTTLGMTALKTTIPGGASTDGHAGIEDPNGFTVTTVIRTPPSPTSGGIILASRGPSSGSFTEGWEFILQSTQLRAQINLSTGVFSHAVGIGSWIQWGAVMGFRLQADVVDGVLRRWYSFNPLDESPSWIELGQVSISGHVGESSHPFSVIAPRGNAVAPVLRVELRDSENEVVAGVDFADGDWPVGDSYHTDGSGQAWSLQSGASVGREDPILTTKTYGIAGPRVGYTAAPNYIAGMGFENPSFDGAVIVARLQSGVDSVERHVGSQVEVLHSQPTTRGRLIRPYPPIGGGPFRAIVSDVEHYGEMYTEYRGRMRGLS